jgi:Flp pilus assembly protein TadD
LRKTAEAKTAYRAAIAVNPAAAPALNNLAWLLLITKDDLPQAEKLATRAVAAAPTVATFFDTLGAIYLAEKRVDDATRAYKRALELDPTLVSSKQALELLAKEKKN